MSITLPKSNQEYNNQNFYKIIQKFISNYTEILPLLLKNNYLFWIDLEVILFSCVVANFI